MISENTELLEKINWALYPFPDGITESVLKKDSLTKKQIRENANLKEKEWGNKMIQQVNNSNWTTLFGENLVKEF